jgi:AcrR family transcriptional regulator
MNHPHRTIEMQPVSEEQPPASPPSHTGQRADDAVAPRTRSGVRRRPGRPAAAMPVSTLETRDLILRHARQLFMRRGFADVAVGDVAEAVGVTKPTLYYHFGSKEGLYAAVLVDLMREVGGYIQKVVEQPAPVRARLHQIAIGYFRNASGTMEPMLRDVGQLIGQDHAATVWAAYEHDFLAPLLALMEEGMRAGAVRPLEARSLVRAFVGLLEAFTARGGRAARTPAEHQRIAEEVVALFLDGAAPRA